MSSANEILKKKIDSLSGLNSEAQAALSELRRDNKMLVTRLQFVGSRLAARIVQQRKLQADPQTARLEVNPLPSSDKTLCEPLTKLELADVAADQRHLPERFGALRGYKITLRKRDSTSISLTGIPQGLTQPDEHLEVALEALAKQLESATQGCCARAILVKASANLDPITSKRPSAEYQYAQTIQRYAENPTTGALSETAPLVLGQVNLTNSDLPDVRSAGSVRP